MLGVKRVVVATAVLMALAALPVFGQTLRVLLWDDALTQALKAGLPEFEQATGIKVELELVPSGTLLQKILISVTAGWSDYDLIAVDEPYVPSLAPLLLPLAQWPATNVYKEPDLADFMPYVIDAAQWKGQLWGLPINANVYVWMTRKDIVEEYKDEFKAEFGYELTVPYTLEELLDACQFLAQKGIYGWAPFTKPTEGATCEAIWMFRSFGTDVLEITDEGYRIILDKTKAVEAINFYKELLKYAPPGALDYGHAERIAAFSRGEVFSMFQWPAIIPDHENPDKSLVYGKIVYTAPPAGPVGSVSIRGAWIVAIPKAAQAKQAAAEFAYWWANADVERRLIPYGLTPPRKSLLLDPQILKEKPWFIGIFRALPYAVARPRFEKYAEISLIIRTHWLDAISGRESAEIAVDKMVQEIEALLRKYGY